MEVSPGSTSQVEGATDRWTEGLVEEIGFWFRWLRDRGGPWPDDYAWKTDPHSILQPRVQAYLDSPPDAHLRILDVGSGPLTILGKRWDERKMEITALDPLADRYAELLERFAIRPGAVLVRGQAERLTETFAEDAFDLVYARNCIDHGYDPLLAIRQMLKVVKPGRVVLLDHAVDEGEFMRYAGPHQWNFRLEDGRFLIWRPGLWVEAQAILEEHADVETSEANDDSESPSRCCAFTERYMSVALRKRQSNSTDSPNSRSAHSEQ